MKRLQIEQLHTIKKASRRSLMSTVHRVQICIVQSRDKFLHSTSVLSGKKIPSVAIHSSVLPAFFFPQISSWPPIGRPYLLSALLDRKPPVSLCFNFTCSSKMLISLKCPNLQRVTARFTRPKAALLPLNCNARSVLMSGFFFLYSSQNNAVAVPASFDNCCMSLRSVLQRFSARQEQRIITF